MPPAPSVGSSTNTNTDTNTNSNKWTRRSVYLSFLGLWIAYGLLNQLNSIRGISFDPAAVVWSQEVLKIVLSLLLFFVQDGGPWRLASDVRHHWSMICWYGIPAGLYALGDVLTYVNLRSFDPATLHLLGEMKLVVTAIVHQLFFRRMLNRCHWTALALITAGCIVKALDSMELSSSSASPERGGASEDDDNYGQPAQMPQPTTFNYAMIAVNIALSTIAGVYNEKLLKDKPHLSINLQNMCLYLDGIIFLSLGMLFGLSERGSIVDALSPSSLKSLFSQPTVLSMAVVMSAAGIVTSRFLKVFDSIRKSVAVALVVVSLPFLSRVCFGTPMTIKMLVACALVIGGMYLYTSQPPPKTLEDGQNETEGATGEEEGDEAELFLPAIPIPYGKKEEAAVEDDDVPSGFDVQEQELASVLPIEASQIRNSIV